VKSATSFGRVILDATLGYGVLSCGNHAYANGRTQWVLPGGFSCWCNAAERLGKMRLERLRHGVRDSISKQIRQSCKYIVNCSANAFPTTMPIVCCDDEAIGRMAAEHLIENRLEHFGFYGISPHPVAQSRFKGFRDRLMESGLFLFAIKGCLAKSEGFDASTSVAGADSLAECVAETSGCDGI